MKRITFCIPLFYFLFQLHVVAQNDSTTIFDKIRSEKGSIEKSGSGKIENNIFTDFKPGYIISLNGDTLSGMIDYRNDLKMSKTCRFIPKNATSEVVYKPNEIRAFRFENGKFFVSRDLKTPDNQPVKLFLEYLIHGKVDVYYYKDTKGNHYLIDKEGRELTELPYEEKIKTDSNGVAYFDKSTKYIGILLLYMSDTPSMSKEITETKEPSHESLIKLAKDYHKASCGDYSCIIYEKKESLVHYKVELVAGVEFIGNSVQEEFISNSYFTTGVIVKLGDPRVNENLYIKTGLLYSHLENSGYWTDLHYNNNFFTDNFKVPLQMEYIIQKGTFQPRIGYGINLYYPIFSTVSITPGLDIKLSKKIAVTINSDIEFVPMLFIVPQIYMGVTLSAGISYAF